MVQSTGSVLADLPGYCWLWLFQDHTWTALAAELGKYPTRGAVEAQANSSTAHLHFGYFNVVYGTAASVEHSCKYMAHVTRSNPQQSLLRAKDVVALMPYGSRYGAFESDSATITTASHAQVTTQQLSPTMPSAPELQLAFVSTGGKAPKDGGAAMRTVDFLTGAHVQAAIGSWPVVSLVSATVTIMPTPCSVGYHTSVAAAWFPIVDSSPNTREGVLARPAATYTAFAPTVPGAAPASYQMHCPLGRDMVSSAIKPRPPIGGPPKLVVWYRPTSLAGFDGDDGEELFELFFQITVRVGA